MEKSPITQSYSEFLLVVKTHLAEYVNKPLLNIGFILSLAIATSTLLCILVLNHASQKQYHDANNRLKSPIAFNIVPKDGEVISVADFSRLRKLGFHQLSAAHVFRQTLENGKKISFRAIDILPLVLTMPESFTSKTINISKKYARSLEIKTKDKLVLADKRSLIINVNDVNGWSSVALLDITLAWALFPDIKGFSHLMVAAMPEHEISRLEAQLPEYLSIQEAWSLEEREGFADALHLNLSALAVLGFIVSLFIAYQAANQAWTKRGELAAKLRLLGVELTTIQKVMLCESLLLTLLASLIGIGLSIALVAVLLPLLGLTLDQLYQLRLSGHFQWTWQYSLWAFAISAIAVVVALIKQFKTIGSEQIALSARPVNKPFNFKSTLLIALSLLVAFILWPTNNWYQLMIKYGVLLMASVAVLPNILRYLLQGLASITHSFRLKFIFKDASQQVGRRFLPLAAFYLALTSSISAALMVNSFETSFVSYLNQLLNSDLFISYKTEQKSKVSSWLDQQDDVAGYVLFQKTIAKYDQYTVDVYTLASKQQHDSLLLKEKSMVQVSTEKNTCYINEQLAFKQLISLQQDIEIQQGKKEISCVVVGIYYDYGNQGFAIKMPVKEGIKELSGWQEIGFGVFLKADASLSKQVIIAQLSLHEEQVFEPEQIKQLALGIFEQTFVLTQAIAFVLLSIACFGLFLSANSLELGRKPDLHILSSLGFSRFELFTHMLLQWLILACGAILLSWPVAIILANALVSLVLPASFGWSMPLVLDIAPFAASSLIGLVILIPALGIPLYKLNVRASLS
ncbi:MAG: putative ABC transport system permease protein [Alteromonadaceae bacterium]|jgi:putative ABC transport system permease protein